MERSVRFLRITLYASSPLLLQGPHKQCAVGDSWRGWRGLLFSHFGIDEDTSAELAHDDFLAQADIQLALCGDLAVATAATIALDLDDRQTVVCVLADTLESGEETLVDGLFEFGGADHKRFGFGFGLGEDRVEFTLFLVEIDGLVLDVGNGLFFLGASFLEFGGEVVDLLLAEFDVELLVLDFLVEVVVLAVVADALLLLLVACDRGVGVLGANAVVGDLCLALFDAVLDVLEACFEPFDLVAHVLYFLWQFACECAEFVDARIDLLEFVEGFEFLLYGQFLFLFRSHNYICILFFY